jgi:competence protein ComEA
MKSFLNAAVLILAWCGVANATININIANKEDLTSLKGVGAKTAQVIIDYRNKNGPFKSVDDLEKVPGVTPALMKQVRPQISTSGSSLIQKPVNKTRKRKAKMSSAKTTERAKTQSLTPDKSSKKTTEKPTTGMKTKEKKIK